MNKRITGIATLCFVAATGTVLLWPRSLCACLGPAAEFEEEFGVDALSASDADIQRAIAVKLPRGTEEKDVRSAFDECTSQGDTLRCTSRLAKSAFGLHRRGVEATFRLDAASQVVHSDARSTRSVCGL